MAANLFVKEFKQFILNTIVVRILFCVDAAFEVGVVLNMLGSGDFAIYSYMDVEI